MTLMFGSAEYKIDEQRVRQNARYDDAQLDCRNQQCLSGRVRSPYRQTLEIQMLDGSRPEFVGHLSIATNL